MYSVIYHQTKLIAACRAVQASVEKAIEKDKSLLRGKEMKVSKIRNPLEKVAKIQNQLESDGRSVFVGNLDELCTVDEIKVTACTRTDISTSIYSHKPVSPGDIRGLRRN